MFIIISIFSSVFKIYSLFNINMDPILAWILSPILFGVLFILQTTFFLYKLTHNRYADDVGVNSVHITKNEVTWCMGWLWIVCLNRVTSRMTLSLFIIWYLVNICFDVAVSIGLFLIIKYANDAET
jgi:hypothetical protein